MASRAIPDKDRNTFFASYCKEGKNKVCVDCGAPNPQWATAYFGILFCLECSGQHRSLGTHLTFVRSITMDTWKEREIACMRAGGNDAMLAWWKAHDVSAKGSIRDKYNHPATQEYREKVGFLPFFSLWASPRSRHGRRSSASWRAAITSRAHCLQRPPRLRSRPPRRR